MMHETALQNGWKQEAKDTPELLSLYVVKGAFGIISITNGWSFVRREIYKSYFLQIVMDEGHKWIIASGQIWNV